MNEVIWLRISFWAAAIADFVLAGLIMIPDLQGTNGYVFPMGLMSAAALSWGIMLVIADRDPLNRRWVSIPTILVVGLIGLVSVHALVTGVIAVEIIGLSLCSSMILFSLLIVGYWKTRNM